MTLTGVVARALIFVAILQIGRWISRHSDSPHDAYWHGAIAAGLAALLNEATR